MPRLSYFLCLAVLAASVSLGASEAELRVSGAPNTGAVGATVDVDLGAAQRWSLTGTYDASAVTKTALPGTTEAGSLEIAREGRAVSWKLGAFYGNDHVNQVTDLEPMAGLAYTQRHGPADGDGERPELFSVSLDAGLHFYQVDMGDNTEVASAVPGQLPFLVNKHALLELQEFAPTLTLEAPLFHGASDLAWSGGRNGFSKDPAVVASVIEDRYDLGAGQGRISGLLGTLYDRWWDLAWTQNFGKHLALNLAGGQDQLASSGDWINAYEAGLRGSFGDHWSARLDLSTQVDASAVTGTLLAAAGFTW
ncbi:MAG TPA: hypothetical protein VK842_02345 [bacterium]|jgi:hypothetical protein|nr:hypothetical protein [bacterium]